MRLWSTVVSQLISPVLAVGRQITKGLASACSSLPMNPAFPAFATASDIGNALGLLQTLQIGDERNLVLRGELNVVRQVAVHPHLVARFDRARIVNPPAHLLGGVLQKASRNSGAGADVRELGIERAAARLLATDDVAGEASLRLKELPALGD